MEAELKANFNNNRIAATYGHTEFKADVYNWLKQKFGNAVTLGTKAIYIKGEGSRRDADVIVCAKYRRYRKDSNGNDAKYDEGISFFKSDGTRINNFPIQHAENCTLKHKGSNNWFKPTVRIYKNIRNRMVEKNILQEGVAPSYFIEGMLWNVPLSEFGKSYGDTFVAALNWIRTADKTKLACANDLMYLVRDDVAVCWPAANFDAYVSKVTTYWNNWDS